MNNLKTTFTKSTGHKLVALCAIGTALALLPMPYSFFILLRLAFFGSLIWFGLSLYRQTHEMNKILYLIGALAIFYNPLFIVELGNKPLWLLIDIATLYFLFSLANKSLEKKR